jgi:hypothetical protein
MRSSGAADLALRKPFFVSFKNSLLPHDDFHAAVEGLLLGGARGRDDGPGLSHPDDPDI